MNVHVSNNSVIPCLVCLSVLRHAAYVKVNKLNKHKSECEPSISHSRSIFINF